MRMLRGVRDGEENAHPRVRQRGQPHARMPCTSAVLGLDTDDEGPATRRRGAASRRVHDQREVEIVALSVAVVCSGTTTALTAELRCVVNAAAVNGMTSTAADHSKA